MFTFGRDHEKACAVSYVRNPAERQFVEGLVDAIHDVLEGIVAVPAIRPLLEHGLAKGGAGVWEQTGTWLRKLAGEHPELLGMLRELASHHSAEVRFRVAAHLSDMPRVLARELGALLLADRSAKVRRKAAGDLGRVHSPDVLRLLQQALAIERKQPVTHALEWAIEQVREGLSPSCVGGA